MGVILEFSFLPSPHTPHIESIIRAIDLLSGVRGVCPQVSFPSRGQASAQAVHLPPCIQLPGAPSPRRDPCGNQQGPCRPSEDSSCSPAWHTAASLGPGPASLWPAPYPRGGANLTAGPCTVACAARLSGTTPGCQAIWMKGEGERDRERAGEQAGQRLLPGGPPHSTEDMRENEQSERSATGVM